MKIKTRSAEFKSITEYLGDLGLARPYHPKVAVVKYDDREVSRRNAGKSFLVDFFKISLRINLSGKVRNGEEMDRFEEGGLVFQGPYQRVTLPTDESFFEDGYNLYFHPDFIRLYPLGKKISQFGFFSYETKEALFLSGREKQTLINIFENIATELENDPDFFSHDVIAAQIELLLNYSNRFYNRQFMTRKAIYNDLITQMDNYLDDRFENKSAGVPTVQEVADFLQVSSRYLTDMLKSLTGQGAQQHIHFRLIEKAKEKLCSTRTTIAEIGYQFGFEHPQSFNKLFKKYTNMTPNGYRKSFD